MPCISALSDRCYPVRREWAEANVHNFNNPREAVHEHWCRWCMAFSSVSDRACSCANALCTAVLAHGKWLRCLRPRPVTPTPHPEARPSINTDDSEVLRPAFPPPLPLSRRTMSGAGVPSASLDAGVDLSNSYGGPALGCVLCTVFWSFLLVQMCVGFPLPSFMAMRSSFSTGCTTRLSQCHLPSQRHGL
jgi:hypothetical protein